MGSFRMYFVLVALFCITCLSFPSQLTYIQLHELAGPGGAEHSLSRKAIVHDNCSIQQLTGIDRAIRTLLRLMWSGLKATRQTRPTDFEQRRFQETFGRRQFGDTRDVVHEIYMAIYFEAMRTKYPSGSYGQNRLRICCEDIDAQCIGDRPAYYSTSLSPTTIVLVGPIPSHDSKATRS